MKDDDLVLTVPEAAERLRVSLWTINSLIRSKQLGSIKVGRRRLVPCAALVAYVHQLMEEAA